MTHPRHPALLLLALALPACGTDVAGPSAALLSCALGDPTALATGEVAQRSGEAAGTVCLTPAGSAGGVFAFIPFYGALPADSGANDEVSLEVTGGGFTSPAAVGTAANLAVEDRVLLRGAGESDPVAPGELPIDWGFHTRLRRREIRELTPLLRAGGRTAPTAAASQGAGPSAIAADVPTVGELRDFNVAISCSVESIRTGEVVYVSDHAVVIADTSNPADLGAADYAHFAVTFDTLIHPVATAHFGAVTDIDANGRSILFFTTAVNALNAHDATSVVLGFFWSGDIFPAQQTGGAVGCPGGNRAEMFYLIAPDPDGVAGRAITLDEVRQRAIRLIGHEYQHLVNAARRLWVNDAVEFEDVWLSEGLSHAAEELLFFEASGLETGQNLDEDDLRGTPGGVDHFNEYMSGNFTNYRLYLARPDTSSVMANDDELATRGAAWAFVRYAADRSGRGDEAFFFDLVNSRVAGLDNLAEVLDGDPIDWMRDWTVSVYADDFVPGVDPRFQLLSWDLRSVYEGSTVERYPLHVVTLTSGGVTSLDLQAGGAAYTRFGIRAGDRAVVSAQENGGTPPATLRGSVLREQ